MRQRDVPRREVVAVLVVVTCALLPPFLTGALALQIRQELNFSTTGLGAAIGIFFGASALSSAPLGRLVERVGWRAGMQLGALAAWLSLTGIALFARSWGMLTTCLLLGGIGNGMTQPAANLALARIVATGRQGLVFGVKQSAIPLATLVGGLSVPAIALTVGWRWTYVGAAISALIAAIIVPADDVRGDATEEITETTRPQDSTSVHPLRFIAVAGGLGAVVASGLGVFLVSTASESGINEAYAGLLLGLGSAIGLVTRVSSGWAADVRPFKPLHAVAGLLGAGSLGCLLIASLEPIGLLFGTILAFGAGWGWPGLMNLAVVRGYVNAPAMATGITQTGVYVGAAAGPMAFGLVVDFWGFAWAWVLTAAIAVLAAGFSLYGERRIREGRLSPRS